MNINESITALEQKIFDPTTIKGLPFEFFNYIYQVISKPNQKSQIPVPNEAEIFFQTKKTNDASHLFKYITENKVVPLQKTFLGAYADLVLNRYRNAFLIYGKYVLRRIQTNEEYGLFNALRVKDLSRKHYIAFDIDRFIVKNQNGGLNIKKTIQKEQKENNIIAYFSTVTSLPETALIFRKYFEETTIRGLFPTVFDSELNDLILELCDDLLTFFSKVIYRYLVQNISLNEIMPNVKEYYYKSVNPDNYKFSAELEPLMNSCINKIYTHLNNMKELNPKSKEEIYYELLETILVMVQNGLMFPINFYLGKFRKASKLDLHDYNTHYVFDLYTFNDSNIQLKQVFESYGLVIDNVNTENILRISLNNSHLYKNFIKLSK